MSFRSMLYNVYTTVTSHEPFQVTVGPLEACNHRWNFYRNTNEHDTAPACFGIGSFWLCGRCGKWEGREYAVAEEDPVFQTSPHYNPQISIENCNHIWLQDAPFENGTIWHCQTCYRTKIETPWSTQSPYWHGRSPFVVLPNLPQEHRLEAEARHEDCFRRRALRTLPKLETDRSPSPHVQTFRM